MTDPRIIPQALLDSALNGITAIIYVSITIIIGLLVISKYFKYKDKKLLIIGLNIIILPAAYLTTSIGYILALGGIYIEDFIYGIMVQVPRALNLFLWVYIFSELHYKEKQKKFILICVIYLLIWEIIYFTLAFLDHGAYLIVRQGLIDAGYRLPLLILVLSQLGIFAITFILFARIALKSVNPEIHLKGKFSIYFLIAYATGTILARIPLDILILPSRIILMFGPIFLYFVFAMPEGVKKRLLKNK